MLQLFCRARPDLHARPTDFVYRKCFEWTLWALSSTRSADLTRSGQIARLNSFSSMLVVYATTQCQVSWLSRMLLCVVGVMMGLLKAPVDVSEYADSVSSSAKHEVSVAMHTHVGLYIVWSLVTPLLRCIYVEYNITDIAGTTRTLRSIEFH